MSLHCCSYPMSTNFTLLPSSKPSLFFLTLTKFSREAPRRRIQLRILTGKKKLAARSDDRQPVSQSESTLSKVEDDSHNGSGGGGDGRNSGSDLGWLPAFPHVLAASMSNFLFGYHIGVMNGPILSVARELGFEGNTILEGLVVSIFIAGAFVGSIVSGSLTDKVGCRKTIQIATVPLILGAILSFLAVGKPILWITCYGEGFLLV